MKYSFVMAKLLPERSLAWTQSNAAVTVAKRMKTRPFIALKVPSEPAGFVSSFQELETLLLVSPTKPQGLKSHGFVPISPNTDGSRPPITISPPPRGGEKLYFHTCFRLHLCRPKGKISELSDHSLSPLDLQHMRARTCKLFCVGGKTQTTRASGKATWYPRLGPLGVGKIPGRE
jgi:hypothetical protein